jgi:hypothetical protein
MNPDLRKSFKMIPVLINDTGRWLDRFAEVLDRWESLLAEVQSACFAGDHVRVQALCHEGEAIHKDIHDCKLVREKLIFEANEIGYSSRSLRELSIQLDTLWPALWTHRISNLELQLDRIQQLSMSMWVTAFQSKSYVSELLLILSTGKADSATYAPAESQSLEGGYLVNEAA